MARWRTVILVHENRDFAGWVTACMAVNDINIVGCFMETRIADCPRSTRRARQMIVLHTSGLISREGRPGAVADQIRTEVIGGAEDGPIMPLAPGSHAPGPRFTFLSRFPLHSTLGRRGT